MISDGSISAGDRTGQAVVREKERERGGGRGERGILYVYTERGRERGGKRNALRATVGGHGANLHHD